MYKKKRAARVLLTQKAYSLYKTYPMIASICRVRRLMDYELSWRKNSQEKSMSLRLLSRNQIIGRATANLTISFQLRETNCVNGPRCRGWYQYRFAPQPTVFNSRRSAFTILVHLAPVLGDFRQDTE